MRFLIILIIVFNFFSEKENIYEQIYNNNDDIELETAGGTHDKVPFQVYCPNCRTTQIYKGVWDKERKNFGIYCTVDLFCFFINYYLNFISFSVQSLLMRQFY